MPNPEKRPITAEDLYDLQLVSAPQISPDGQHVVFSLQRVDKKTEKKYSNLWVASIDMVDTVGIVGADQGDHIDGPMLRQFTYGDQLDRQPQWSPDGRQIAFISNRSNHSNQKEAKQAQFYLLPFHGGEARPLTNLQGTIGRYSWSPDGTRLVCTFRKKDAAELEREDDAEKKKLGVVARHITRLDFKEDGVGYLPEERWHLWTIDTTTGAALQLTDSDLYDDLEPSWSPDGQKIVFRSNRADEPDIDWDHQDLFIILATGGEIQKLAAPPGLKQEPKFSPDGQWIAYYQAGDRRRLWQPTDLYVIPATGGGPARNLTEAFDLDVGHATMNDIAGGDGMPPIWSTDSQRIYFQVSQHGSTLLKSVTINEAVGDAEEALQTIVGPGGAVGGYDFDRAQARLVYFLDTPTDPGQIWLRDMTTGETRQLTAFNQDLLAALDLGELETVWYKGRDGHALQGWILKPPGFDPAQKYPAILEIHGGPMRQYGAAFMHEFYYLAGQGYVVFYTNPRGGSGYGAAHTKAIYNQWGALDYADVMAWTDLVQAKPYIDEMRLGVTGGSYGGYMTNWIIGHTDRFQAAVTQRSVSNFISMFGSSDLYSRWQALFGAEAPPWEDMENYWQQSPLKYFGNVKTPTLVIHSEGDMRCHIEQGEQVFVALKLLGVETELVRFPSEPHGLSRGGRTDRRIVRLSHILRWFDKYLK